MSHRVRTAAIHLQMYIRYILNGWLILVNTEYCDWQWQCSIGSQAEKGISQYLVPETHLTRNAEDSAQESGHCICKVYSTTKLQLLPPLTTKS